MPEDFENFPLNWDDVEEECQYVSLNCPWTITSDNETLAIIITSLEWTCNYHFWIRKTAHPEGNPNITRKININKHHPLLESLSEALNDYMDFPEPPLNTHQLYILGQLLAFLF